ncbi:MAG: site-specific integrase [Desulfamplus sp.]|nr:site-specific integrase [Desulfamplus sp.]
MAGWNSTKYPGVRYREHETRKHGIMKDRYFAVRYQKDKTRKEEGVGWASEGWTIQKVALKLAELKEAAVTGQGESRLSAQRKKRESERIRIQDEQDLQEKESLTLDEYFIKKYYPSIKHGKRRTTHIREEQLFRIWISPLIGNKTLKDISAFDIERLKKNMMDAKKSPRTIEYCFITLGQIFRHAQKHGYHTGDIPTLSVKRIKFDNKRVRFLSLDESHRLLDILKGSSQQVYEMALLSLHCGLRAGEIFSLQWKDIDLEHGIITLLDTKSGRTRTLSMTDDVKDILMHKEKTRDIIFPARDGGKIKAISNAFTRAVDKAGLNNGVNDRRQKVTFHTLRHSFASWLVMEGISLYQVKELLGHASITMTERYSHLAPDKNRLAAETMDKIFQKPEAERTRKIF